MRLPKTLLAAALLAGATGACDSSQGSPLGLAVDLYAPAGQAPFQGVNYLRIWAEDDTGPVTTPTVVPYDGPGSASLDNIPFGVGRSVVVEGWQGQAPPPEGVVVSRGQSTRARVDQGAAAQTLPLMFAQVNTFAPLTNAESRLPSSLGSGRVGHTVTRNAFGDLFVIGGGTVGDASASWWNAQGFSALSKSVEVIDEATGAIRQVANSLFYERAWHTTTALNTGQLLVAGGYSTISGSRQAIRQVEVYDPKHDRFDVLAAQMAVARAGHTATLIGEGSFTVLFVGGDADTAATGTYETWNPVTGKISVRDLPDGQLRRHHTATLFRIPGRTTDSVLIAGGESPDGPLNTALVYDIATDTMTLVPGTLSVAKTQATATWVPARNFIYVAGGFTSQDRTQATATIDVYNVGTQEFFTNPGFALRTPRGGQAAAPLRGNAVLLSGGLGTNRTPLNSVEIIYEYLDPGQGAFVIDVAQSNTDPSNGDPLIPYLSSARFGQRALTMESGMALLVGGVGVDGQGTTSNPTDLTVYNPQ